IGVGLHGGAAQTRRRLAPRRVGLGEGHAARRHQPGQSLMLELDDIQHFLLARPRALAARYGFLTFRQPAGGRAWLSGIIDKVGTGGVVGSGGATDSRWVTVAFTWNGLRALGLPEASLTTFPEEFRQGMAARAEVLGDTGANHPDHWVGSLAS